MGRLRQGPLVTTHVRFIKPIGQILEGTRLELICRVKCDAS